MKLTRGEKVFVVCNDLFMLIVAAICVLPVLHIFARAFSSAQAIGQGRVIFWPVDFHIAGITYILEETSFLVSLRNSLVITAIGTVLAVFCAILTAFALAQKEMKGRTFFLYLYVFCMIFHAGIVPNYFLMKRLGFLNTLWCLILPAVVNPYYILVLKRGFETFPSSLKEAAQIDGASWFTILWQIAVPVSKAQIATIVVFYSVHYWNKYTDALIYVTDNVKSPITMFLYNMVKNTNIVDFTGIYDELPYISQDVFNAATVLLAVLPILAVYPLMQRYFVRGTMAGAIKG
ncbi:MAG: carbohydrate ABC transporter permease [Sphaerochaetaceae bacterium]|nr:carbohydrate ABC transporter permease [Sphaerochaetaceae bacterium]